MALPTQIDSRLAAVGARAADVEERFVRGTGPGGQKIGIGRSNPAVRLAAKLFGRCRT